MIIRTDYKEFSLLIEFSNVFEGEKERLQLLLEKYSERWKNAHEIVWPDAALVREASWITYVTAELLHYCKWTRWARVVDELDRSPEEIARSLDEKSWHYYDGEKLWPRMVAAG